MDYIEDHILDQTWTNIQNHPKKKVQSSPKSGL